MEKKQVEKIRIDKEEISRQKKEKFFSCLTKDIKYHGPLSYRTIRIIGWLFFALGTSYIVFQFGAKLYPASSKVFDNLGVAARLINFLGLPCFLVANLGLIFEHKTDYKKMVIKYAILMVGLYIIINAIIFHYVAYSIMKINAISYGEALRKVDGFFDSLDMSMSSFNVFVDLFLFTLMYFFLMYKPVKHFKGNKIYIFRSFIIFPILYELGCIIVKYQAAVGNMYLPFYFATLMTSKTPIIFLAFLTVLFLFKWRQIKYYKYGGLKKDYERFIKTNKSSFVFSLTICLTFVAFVLIDFLVTTFITVYKCIDLNMFDINAIAYGTSVARTLGFGLSFPFLIVAPMFLLFSYTRQYKNKVIDILIPIGGVALTVFILIEGFYEVLIHVA